MEKYRKLGENFAIVHYQFAKYINKNYSNNTIICSGRDCYLTYYIIKYLFKNNNVKYIPLSRKALLNTAWNTNFKIDSEVNKFIYESIIFTYHIRDDDHRLRESVETFEKHGEDYPVRREFKAFKIF